MSTARQLAVSLLALLVSATVAMHTAAASGPASDDGDPFGGEGGQEGGSTTVTFSAENVLRSETDFPAVVPAARPNAAIAPGEPLCAEYAYDDTIGAEACFVAYVCGGERVDDVFSGAISGGEARGAYAEYLEIIEGLLVGAIGSNGWLDEDSVSDYLVATGLESQPASTALPVFNYCRLGEGGPIETEAGGFSPSIGWQANAVPEYDLDRIRSNLVDRLTDKITLNEPTIATIPPNETGRTWVHFPMWLWLDDLVDDTALWAQSDLETIRLAARANLQAIEWQLGDISLACDAADMRAYEPGTDPTENVPDCHHVFDELTSFTLQATVTYRVEEQIAIRLSRLQPFPDVDWVPHPTRPTITFDLEAGDVEVSELVSLNVLTQVTNRN